MQENVISSDFRQAKWYVLFVRINQGKRVVHHLSAMEKEHFLPLHRSLRQWKDRRVELERPLFPGYVFVKIPFPELFKILTVPNVISCLGARNSPAEIAEDEIAWLQRGLAQGTVEPHPYLKTGERVMVISGVMSGMEGILVRKQNSLRVVISLGSIERAFMVEVGASCVEPIKKQPPELQAQRSTAA